MGFTCNAYPDELKAARATVSTIENQYTTLLVDLTRNGTVDEEVLSMAQDSVQVELEEARGMLGELEQRAKGEGVIGDWWQPSSGDWATEVDAVAAHREELDALMSRVEVTNLVELIRKQLEQEDLGAAIAQLDLKVQLTGRDTWKADMSLQVGELVKKAELVLIPDQ